MDQIVTKLKIEGCLDTRQGGRAENQDSYFSSDTPHGLLVMVCDGMGGGPAGKTASVTAVQNIFAYVNSPQNATQTREEVLRNAIGYAHQCILNLGVQNPALRGMGTTVSALLINEESAIVAHVGDSRIYQIRRGKKIFRTLDHSYVGELVQHGDMTEEQARLSSQSNIITRALGGPNSEPDICERCYEAGDRFMLCSDGIWGTMPEPQLIKSIAKTPSLAGAVNGIVLDVDDIGKSNGNHHDNLTIALLETKEDSNKKEKMSKRTRKILLGLAAVCLISLIANCVLMSKLMKPSVEKQEFDAQKVQIAQLKNTIDSLRNAEYKLRNDVASSKQEAADAKMDAANEKAQAAEKAKQEAEKKQQEAKEAAEKAKTSAEQSKASADAKVANINKAVKEVIDILTKALNAKTKNERTSSVNAAVAKLKKLNAEKYKGVIAELNKEQALRMDSRGQGQIKSQIEALHKIK